MHIVAPPDLLPLRRSYDADAVEADLKQIVLDLFNKAPLDVDLSKRTTWSAASAYVVDAAVLFSDGYTYVCTATRSATATTPPNDDAHWRRAVSFRDRERELNVYGMAHLGSFELLQRIVTRDGLALLKRDDTEAMRYLFKAWRTRNPKRGLHFIKTYLQLLWPNAWIAEQYWHKKSDPYPLGTVSRGDITDPDPTTNHWLTSRLNIAVEDPELEDVVALFMVLPALRSVAAARFVLLVVVNEYFENPPDESWIWGDGAATIRVVEFRDSSLPAR